MGQGGKQGGVIACMNGSFLGGALSPSKGDEAISINLTFAIGAYNTIFLQIIRAKAY
jgi:hypothetical protein